MKNDEIIEDLAVELEKAYQLNLVLEDYLQRISEYNVTNDKQGILYSTEQTINRMVTVQELVQTSMEEMRDKCNIAINEIREAEHHERL